jgi:hypothetical protein
MSNEEKKGFFDKPVLMSVLSQDDKKNLLKNSNFFKWLTMKQLLKLIWWKWFYKKKIEVFYNGLNIGKAVIFAFKDAEVWTQDGIKNLK